MYNKNRGPRAISLLDVEDEQGLCALACAVGAIHGTLKRAACNPGSHRGGGRIRTSGLLAKAETGHLYSIAPLSCFLSFRHVEWMCSRMPVCILPEIVRQLGDVCIHSLFVLTGLATACAKPPHSHSAGGMWVRNHTSA